MSKIRSKSREERYRKKTKILRYLVLVLIFIFTGLFFWYTESGKFDLRLGEVKGAGLVSSEAIKSLIVAESRRPVLRFISRNNLFLYPDRQIEEKIINTYPAVKSAKIVTIGGKVDAIVEERKASYLWCGDDMDLSEDGCYYVDLEGIIFARAASFTGTTYVKLYKPLSKSIDEPIGQSLFSDEDLFSINDLLSNLRQIGFVGEKVAWRGNHELVVRTSKGVDIMAKLRPDNKSLVRTIDLILKQSEERATSSVYVIDARIEKKIYLKYR